MRYRPMGNTGILVSERGFGAGSLRTLDDDGRKDADAKVGIALDHGVNLFDTADAYSEGRSEELLGGALRGRRDDVLIATKVRSRTFDGVNGEGLTRKHIIRSLEASLRRLGTDYIDLYQLHHWDGSTPLEETLGALSSLVDQGKVRYVGVSNFSGWHLMRALGLSYAGDVPRLATQQIHYSPFTRDAEYELLPASRHEGVGVLIWSPLGGGLLGGRIRSSDVVGSENVLAWREPPVDSGDRLADVLAVLEQVAERNGCTVSDAVLAWTLSNPVVSSVLVGGRTPEQVTANLAGFEVAADDLDLIERSTRPPLIYPYWHQAVTAGPRMSPADRVLHGSRLG